jgi:hypothetical protein
MTALYRTPVTARITVLTNKAPVGAEIIPKMEEVVYAIYRDGSHAHVRHGVWTTYRKNHKRFNSPLAILVGIAVVGSA